MMSNHPANGPAEARALYPHAPRPSSSHQHQQQREGSQGRDQEQHHLLARSQSQQAQQRAQPYGSFNGNTPPYHLSQQPQQQHVAHFPVQQPSSHGLQYPEPPDYQNQQHMGLAMGRSGTPNGNGQHTSMRPVIAARSNSPQNAASPKEKRQRGGTRLGKACDSCSARKVKCDDQKPACSQCAKHGLECTQNRPDQKRGPQNKSVQELKKRQALEAVQKQGPMMAMDPPSYPTAPDIAAATLTSLASHGALNLESILPIPVLRLMIDDFFTYIHPVAPLPHGPSFSSTFELVLSGMQDQSQATPEFVALVSSMVAALVASFARQPRVHIKNHNLTHRFPTSTYLVRHCHQLAIKARGSKCALAQDITIYDAITSYFLGLALAYAFDFPQARLHFSETISFLRVVGATKRPSLDSGEPVDHIKEELGRRLFWVMLVGSRSLLQLGAVYDELWFPSQTPTNLYPFLPTEVDDEYISNTQIVPMPHGQLSRLTGFNLNIKLYACLTPLYQFEGSYGVNEVFDWDRQKKILEDTIKSVRDILKDIPQDLNFTISPKSEFDHPPPQRLTPYAIPEAKRNDMDWDGSEAGHRAIAYDVQKANFYVSQLATRSYLTEKYDLLMEKNKRNSLNSSSNSDLAEFDIAGERESVVQDLLAVIGGISQESMEPNGGSLVSTPLAVLRSPLALLFAFLPLQINKIRQVASTCISIPESRKGAVALKAQQSLEIFVKVLMNLEMNGPREDDAEAEELRLWADLREQQMKFAQGGGFLKN